MHEHSAFTYILHCLTHSGSVTDHKPPHSKLLHAQCSITATAMRVACRAHSWEPSQRSLPEESHLSMGLVWLQPQGSVAPHTPCSDMHPALALLWYSAGQQHRMGCAELYTCSRHPCMHGHFVTYHTKLVHVLAVHGTARPTDICLYHSVTPSREHFKLTAQPKRIHAAVSNHGDRPSCNHQPNPTPYMQTTRTHSACNNVGSSQCTKHCTGRSIKELACLRASCQDHAAPQHRSTWPQQHPSSQQQMADAEATAAAWLQCSWLTAAEL